jgi:hypothetical protein
MERKMKNIFFMLVLLSIAKGAWAQNLPGNIWSSPQSTTTEGRYRSNADDFIRPDTYTGVKFNKWFGLAAFNDVEYRAITTVGFATKISSLYIGAFYSGNFWTNAPSNNYSEMGFSTAPNGGVADKIYNVYSSISVVPEPVNNVALIIGVADMGFRLTYRTNYQLFNKSDIVVTGTPNQLYKNYQAEGGYIAPQIAWAMAKDLTNNGIKPYVTLDLIFDRDYEKSETSGADVSGNSGERIVRSQNHFEPVLAAGMGGYTFYNKDDFRASADLDYALTLKIYDNEYSYADNGRYKTGKIKGTFSPGILPYVEQSYVLNSFTPSVSGSWSSDRLSLRFKLNLPLSFSTEESSIMGLDSSKSLIRSGDSNLINTFIFRPDLRLAMQYKIVPEKLALNVGARIQSTPMILETVTRKIYDTSGNETATQIIHQDSFNGSFVSRFHIGAAFNFSENVWLEATTGVTNAYGNIAVIDVFAPGGLFSFGSILFALKF